MGEEIYKQVQMNVLLIDDEEDIRRSIGGYLEDIGHRVFLADRGEKGLKILEKEAIDIVVTDLKMPGMDGFEVLRRAKEISANIEVIMVTAHGDISGAVRAIREGAFDFFTKPVKLRDLTASLERTTRFHALRLKKDRYREQLDRIQTEAQAMFGLNAMVGKSNAFDNVRELILRVSETDATTVLIYGETGTGKELVARAIHYESARASGPFVAVNCSAIPESLIESEFYGHEKGAFTDARSARKGHFELADRGTLMLDEIGDMDLAMQARLLRTLEERKVRRVGGSKEFPVDVRVISATNKDLEAATEKGTFREDLFYRLNTFIIRIPPLRERLEDLLSLAEFFLERYSREIRKPVEGFAPETVALLKSYHFPGNVRELRNMVERAVILARSTTIEPNDLQMTSRTSPQLSGMPTSLNLEEMERVMIEEALRRSNGHRGEAARLLGISRDALLRRLERLGL